MTPYAADIDRIRAAAVRIAGQAHRTPVATCRTIDRLAGRSLFFKCEHLQKVGAFKFRGAYNAVKNLPREAALRGVVTHSSGNHAQALALAARLESIPAYVVMPENSSLVKRRAVEDYGALVTLCPPNLPARETAAARIVGETGACLIPPFDHADVIAGQGTAALELLEQAPELDTLVAPVGGGGLAAGMCLAAAAIRPGIRLFAAEPAGADDAARSFRAGQWQEQTDPQTIADGLRTSLGELTWPILRDHLEGVLTVSEDEIVFAMRLAWERAKLLIEPSSAVALAAVLGDSFRSLADSPNIQRVGIILSGGNVDLDHLPWRMPPLRG
jgi:threonine dehydratase/serine racemase